MSDLKTLIRAANGRGITYREMERRADAAGFRVKFQTFADLANNAPRSWPKHTSTIEGMAAALGVSPRSIVLAYAESLGVDVGQVGFADLVPLSADGMDLPMRDAVLAVIRAATKGDISEAPQQGQEAGGAEQQEPPPIGTGDGVAHPEDQAQEAIETAQRLKDLGIDEVSPREGPTA